MSALRASLLCVIWWYMVLHVWWHSWRTLHMALLLLPLQQLASLLVVWHVNITTNDNGTHQLALL
jgi:hypothetical protein